MIRAFLFDYDGVITRGVPDGTLVKRLTQNLHISNVQAAEWIGAIWTPFVTGKMSEEAVWQFIEEKYGKPIAVSQRDVWYRWAELTPLPEMIAFVRMLKSKGYPVGVVSNATAPTKEEVRKNGGYDEFDFAILSCETGYKKPDPQIFQIALERLPGLTTSEVLFLDDQERVLVGAKAFGFRTILVKDHAKAVREINDLLRILV